MCHTRMHFACSLLHRCSQRRLYTNRSIRQASPLPRTTSSLHTWCSQVAVGYGCGREGCGREGCGRARCGWDGCGRDGCGRDGCGVGGRWPDPAVPGAASQQVQPAGIHGCGQEGRTLRDPKFKSPHVRGRSRTVYRSGYLHFTGGIHPCA